LAILPLGALLPGLPKAYLPLSEPSEDVRNQTGCLLFGCAMGGSLVLSMTGAALDSIGWFWPFAAAITGLSLLVQWRLAHRLRARRWQAAAE